MADTTFDPARAVRFDLARGSVHAGGEARQVLVPVGALDAIAKAGGEVAATLGRAIGVEVGARAVSRLGDGAGATVEAFTTALGGELAVAGFGTLSVERWGRALVVVVEKSAAPEAVLAPLVEAALERAGGKAVACTSLVKDGDAVRFLVSSKAAAEKVRGWLGSGVAWGEALTRLHGKGAA